MKVAIVGFGTEGESAYRYWKARGADITILDGDLSKVVPDDVTSVLGPDYLKQLKGYDVVVRSPGVKPRLIRTKTPVTSVMKEFFDRCPARIIGVTGTKGKGTTATLISEILKAAGWRTWLGGNIGVPPLDFLAKVKASDLVVLELSSFQLMDLEVSPHIAVCLMIASEHMNWHRNMREYVAAKGNIFWHQRPGDVAIYDAENEFSMDIAQLSPGRRIPYLRAPGAWVRDGQVVIDETVICATDEVGLIGMHNLENVCAAITATWELVGRRVAPVRRAVKAFTGLEHRLELAGEVDGVRYFDDSFSTTPETAMAALAAFPEPKVVILGGSDKQSDYGALARAVKVANVRQAVLIGATALKLQAALVEVGFKNITMGPATMLEIVGLVRSLTRKGDVALLSPACASFGMFKNYKERGELFKAAVRNL